MYSWINNERNVPENRKQLPKVNNPAVHPGNPSAEIKLSTVQRCFELEESIQSLSEEVGYTRAGIYQWRKIYLSPIVDCFDGLLVTWNISTKPNAALVNTMLDNAIATLHRNKHPILHSA